MSELTGEELPDDLPRWPFRLAALLGLELWAIFFAVVHVGSGRSVSYDLAATMAPSILLALPIGFAARRWLATWWTSARVGTVVSLACFAALALFNLSELREQWDPAPEPHHFVAVPERVGAWAQLADDGSVTVASDRVAPLSGLDDPPAEVSSRLFATRGEQHVAQLVLITPHGEGDLRAQLRRSRAGVVRRLLDGAGADRPRFLGADSSLGGRLGCGASESRAVGASITCAWAAHDVAGLVVFFSDELADVDWASEQARAFRDAVERQGS